MSKEIGKRMKARRKELHMSAEDVAAKVGLGPSTIYRYERGDISDVKSSVLGKIAEALRTTPADLMGIEDDPSESTGFNPENLPLPPGAVSRLTQHRVTVTHMPPVEPAPAVESAGGLDGIIAQLEALKATQADPRYNLTQREKNLIDAFRELPKRMQDKALRIIAALGDQVEGV